MMSFTSHALRVRDPNRSIEIRISHLKCYISELSRRINMSYSDLRERYLPIRETQLTEAELLAKLHELEMLREQYQARYAAFVRQRQAEKLLGRRCPRKGDLRAVGDIELLPSPPIPLPTIRTSLGRGEQ